MSIPKPRKFGYWERMKATFSAVKDQTTKHLCDDLLSFLRNYTENTQNVMQHSTDRTTEESIHRFLLNDQEFAERFLESFIIFSTKGEFDLFASDFPQKNKNKQSALRRIIQQHCYQVLCLCSLCCPVEIQKNFAEKLFVCMQKVQPDRVFEVLDLTVWTSLLLLINPVKLKNQCDGSAEIFCHFKNLLQRKQNDGDSYDHRLLKGTIQLALGVSIKYGRNSLGLEIPHDYDDIELVNSGINEMAFEFLHAYVIRNPSFTEFLLSVDVIDSLIKNFICYFPEKLVELYNICEEELYSLTDETREGSRLSWQNVPARKAPNFANLHFKAMLELISALYEPNTAQLKQYSREFTDPNCEGLYDFVSKGRAISAPGLKVAYLSMLTSLCKGAESADVFFNLFK